MAVILRRHLPMGYSKFLSISSINAWNYPNTISISPRISQPREDCIHAGSVLAPSFSYCILSLKSFQSKRRMLASWQNAVSRATLSKMTFPLWLALTSGIQLRKQLASLVLRTLQFTQAHVLFAIKNPRLKQKIRNLQGSIIKYRTIPCYTIPYNSFTLKSVQFSTLRQTEMETILLWEQRLVLCRDLGKSRQ